MSYCTASDVKNIATVRRTDAELTSLLVVSSKRVNHDIQQYVFKELVTSIDNVRMNTIDGSNADFYVRNFPLGDYDDDLDVDTSDVIVYSEEDDTETEVTVSSIDASLGKFTLATAPNSGAILRVSYCFTPQHFPISPVSERIKDATAYLTAYLCQVKVPVELVRSFTVDRLRIMKSTEEVQIYFNMYQQIIDEIKAGTGMVQVAEVE